MFHVKHFINFLNNKTVAVLVMMRQSLGHEYLANIESRLCKLTVPLSSAVVLI